MNANKIMAFAAALLFIGFAGCATQKPQTLILRDGSKLTLLAVTYGTNHLAPYKEVYPHWKGPSTEPTEKPCLILWLKQENTTNTYNDYQIHLYDENNAVCVRQFSSSFDGLEPMSVYPFVPRPKIHTNFCSFEFEAFPRHDRKFFARVKQFDRSIPYPAPNEVDVGQFVIDNPVRGPFPKWTAQPLPETARAGDLSVTLTRLTPDVPVPWTPRSPVPNDPVNRAALASFRVEQNGKPVENWLPGNFDIWDHSGNHAFNWWNMAVTNGEVSAICPNRLWNDGSPWKLRVEFYQTSGYNPDEVCTITNIPVHAGNSHDLINENAHLTRDPIIKTVNGVELKFFPARRFTDFGAKGDPQGAFWVDTTKPEWTLESSNTRLSVVKVTNELGREIKTEPVHDYFIVGRLHDLGESKSINVTLAVHRSRFVEFVANPTR